NSGSIGSILKFSWNTLQCVEIDPVRSHFFHQPSHRLSRRNSFVSRSGVPGDNREEDLHAVFVKLLDHGTHSRDSSRQIALEVELVAIVTPQVGVDMQNEN